MVTTANGRAPSRNRQQPPTLLSADLLPGADPIRGGWSRARRHGTHRAGKQRMGQGEFIVRVARPAEIDEASRIDEDSGALFGPLGIDFSALTPEHPYVRNERAQWLAAIERGDVLLAADADGRSAGLLVLDYLDGAPYLEQLSVCMHAMRRGLGTALLQRAIRWGAERGSELWLTTYGHVAWNRPYYERFGFQVVAESECGPELRACLANQRAALPVPEQRVAMRRRTR